MDMPATGFAYITCLTAGLLVTCKWPQPGLALSQAVASL